MIRVVNFNTIVRVTHFNNHNSKYVIVGVILISMCSTKIVGISVGGQLRCRFHFKGFLDVDGWSRISFHCGVSTSTTICTFQNMDGACSSILKKLVVLSHHGYHSNLKTPTRRESSRK